MDKERIGYALGLLFDMSEWEHWDNERWVGEWEADGQPVHPIDLLSEARLALVKGLCTCGLGTASVGKHAQTCILSGIGQGRGE